MISVLIKSAERYSLAEEKIVKVVKRILAEKQIEDVEVSVAFVSPNKIRTLNQKYRGFNKPTSVLSFPQGQVYPPIRRGTPKGKLILGDVVVCPSMAKKQKLEVLDLVIHGIRNLLSEISTPEDLSAQLG